MAFDGDTPRQWYEDDTPWCGACDCEEPCACTLDAERRDAEDRKREQREGELEDHADRLREEPPF